MTITVDPNIPLTWRCEQGKWTQEPDPVMVEHGTEQGEHDDWLSDAGYHPAGDWFGQLPAVRVFERLEEDSNREWRVEFGISAVARNIIMTRWLPDLLDILSKLSLIATAHDREQVAVREAYEQKQGDSRDW